MLLNFLLFPAGRKPAHRRSKRGVLMMRCGRVKLL
jgi:hypothetical protein